MFDVPDISVVVPVYGSDSTLVPLYERVTAVMAKIPASFELIFVDDCGPGHPWELITEMAQRDPRVVGIKLSRNFGQHSAIMAGVDSALGNWIVIMDCDLQDPPEEITRLLEKAHEGHDAVVGCRVKRRDGIFKRMFSRAFHWVFDYMTGQESDATQANFGIYSRKVVDVVKKLPEQPRLFLLLVRWAGFETISIDVAHCERTEGKSSYNFIRKLSLAADTIVSYSNKPLIMFVAVGFFMAFTAFFYGIWIFTHYFLFDYTLTGWTSMMVSIYFLSGILLFGMGVLGIYIARIFHQVKGRPLYVVNNWTPVSNKGDSL